jgi:hypothetical protein
VANEWHRGKPAAPIPDKSPPSSKTLTRFALWHKAAHTPIEFEWTHSQKLSLHTGASEAVFVTKALSGRFNELLILSMYLKGKGEFQTSFLGLAFSAIDGKTFEAVYFRPFNFMRDDKSYKVGLWVDSREAAFSNLKILPAK